MTAPAKSRSHAFAPPADDRDPYCTECGLPDANTRHHPVLRPLDAVLADLHQLLGVSEPRSE